MKGRSAPLGLFWALVLTGCGYTAGLRMPEGTTTIGLEVFDNDGPLPNVERRLHEEMTRSARNLVTGRILDPADADLVVRGEISRYQRRGGLRTGGNLLRETGLVLRVRAWLERDGRPTGRSAVAGVNVGYLTGFLGAEEEAEARALKNLADGLLLQLFGETPPPAASDDAVEVE